MSELFVIERFIEQEQRWASTVWCNREGDTAVNAARGLAEAKKMHPDVLYRIRPLNVNR